MAAYRMAQPTLWLDTSSDDGYETMSSASVTSASTFSSRVSELGMQCVVKNTFLQLQFQDLEDEDGTPCETKRTGHVRSHSAPKKLSHSSISSRSSSATSLVEPVSSPARPYLAYLTMDTKDRKNHTDFYDSCPTDHSSMGMKEVLVLGDLIDSCSTDVASSSESDMCESSAAYRRSHTHCPRVALPLAPTQTTPSHLKDDDMQERGPMETMGMMERHQAGQCRPCLYHKSKSPCMNGAACLFCHFPHPEKKKRCPRPSKAVRLQCKEMAEHLKSAFGEDTQEFQKASELLSTQSAYMRSLLQPRQSLRCLQPRQSC